jgi:hypothetical protein
MSSVAGPPTVHIHSHPHCAVSCAFKMRKSLRALHAPMMLPASVALVALLATGVTSALVVQIDPFASDSIRVRVAPPGVAAVANPPLQVRSRACAAYVRGHRAGVKKAAQHGVFHVMNDRVHGCCPLAESSLLTPSSSLPFLRLHIRHLFSSRLTLPCVPSLHETSHPQPCMHTGCSSFVRHCHPTSTSPELPSLPSTICVHSHPRTHPLALHSLIAHCMSNHFALVYSHVHFCNLHQFPFTIARTGAARW